MQTTDLAAVGVTDARKSRKAVFRRTIDYNASTVNYLKDRLWVNRPTDRRALQPDYLWSPKLCPPRMYTDCPMNCVMSKPVRTSTNKNKCPIYCVCWTPEGRRLITGAFSGEFTLWNGLTFNFETILQAHESQIRCMKWSHNEEWLLTADHSGYVKYWQANMNNVEMYQAHKEPIRGVSFCPFDNKFVTCSDDSTVRIWDFHRCAEERVLRGHGSDVRSVAWHPTLSLIISGSKDAQQPIKLWDPKTGESVTTMYIHKNTCTDVAWNDNGNWFLTASRDHLIKLFDLRNLKAELQTFRGHKRDVMRVAWHPFHECLFASGSADGSIFYWLAGTDTELGAVENAHESMIWSLAWHPLGHILVSGANDFATKFWTRNRPGDMLKETASSAATDSLLQAVNHGVNDTETADHLSITNDLLKALADSTLQNGIIDTTEEKAFVNNPDDISAVEIPGINEGSVTDLNLTDFADDSDERDRNKMRNTRTIPKEFAANWASTRITAMPTVMMPAPSPTQLAAAAVAAAAAVTDFATPPQYLPPVKPTIPAVHKDSDNMQASARTDSIVDRRQKFPGDHAADNQGVVTRSVRPMNYLGQPPEPVEPIVLPREPERPPPIGPRPEIRDAPGKWKDTFDAPLSELNNGNTPVAPSSHLSNRYDDHEPFGKTYSGHDDFPPKPHTEDRDYRDYEHPDSIARKPGPPPPPYYQRAPYENERFDNPHHPIEMRGHGPPREVIPLDHPRPIPHATEPNVPYSHQRSSRFPPDERSRHFPGPRERDWSKGDDGRFSVYHPPGPHPPPPRRQPPPPPPSERYPPARDHFHPEPGMHPPNYFPPTKRPPPPGPLPPDNRPKYSRQDGPWGGRAQW
ncbi:hypothetical protein CRM22_009268 [Opisthorchis felineus]|uniref:Uncharacterized protein n=1 Tax=Opisthorchis felineus TaxID=147828 RepID=A0A4S2L9L2_OPIFE|nr:hypothetical protein CRM22_009268 [Opisthorchis felineus]